MARSYPLAYVDGDVALRGTYYTPDSVTGKLPLVLVAPAWDGLVQEAHDKSAKLADCGYIALAVDLYGNAAALTDMAQMNQYAGALVADRQVLLARMQAAVAAAKTIPGADLDCMAAIGYCFGGLCVLDLARSVNPDIKKVVAFHAALLPSGLEFSAPINASVLVLHGEDDPMVPPEQVLAFKQEFTSRKADWQFMSFGNTVHAFTRPDANMPDIGAVYNAVADRRSWAAMLAFLAERPD